jgi:hypothetical protein
LAFSFTSSVSPVSAARHAASAVSFCSPSSLSASSKHRSIASSLFAGASVDCVSPLMLPPPLPPLSPPSSSSPQPTAKTIAAASVAKRVNIRLMRSVLMAAQ